MAHTYQSITAGSRTYTPQSDMTPEGTITETLTWAAINTDYDTWLELLDSGKQHWSDWYTITPWTDSWTSKTRSDRTYSEVTV